MPSSLKFYALLFSASNVYASYYGGVGVGPFKDSNDNAVCPPGTFRAGDTAWCCPGGTVFDVAQASSDITCCPTAADCVQDLVANGIQCADPSMTLYTSGVQELCCPAGYFLDDTRYCVNTGTPSVFHSTAQSGSLTPDGGFATTSAAAAKTTAGSVATTTSGSGATSTKSSSAGSASPTSNAAASNLRMGTAGVMVSFLAVGLTVVI